MERTISAIDSCVDAALDAGINFALDVYLADVKTLAYWLDLVETLTIVALRWPMPEPLLVLTT